MSMNYAFFGFSLAPMSSMPGFWRAIVAFDGLKLAAAVHCLAMERGRLDAAACGSCLFALLVAYGAASAVGFARRTAADLANQPDSQTIDLNETHAEFERLRQRFRLAS